VIAFLVGSDFAPPEDVERGYLDALRENDWPNPVVSSAADASSPQLGRSGMKMTGPYDWVPPAYWYEQKAGGAFGFNSETSAGATIPTLASLQAMLGPDEQRALWQEPDATQFHAGREGSQFGTIGVFSKALAARYGPPTSFEDYVRKGNVLNYEGARAQFEAYIRNWSRDNPSTGVVYWMLNNGWPSLLWNLFTYDLDQPGAYWGAKKANEPLHALYSLDEGSVVVVNHTPAEARVTVVGTVSGISGDVHEECEARGVAVPALGSARVFELSPPEDELSFVRLLLTRGGDAPSRNVYWLSAQPDVLDWDRTEWYATPTSRDADLTALQGLPPAAVEVTATAREKNAEAVTTVTLASVDAAALAFFVTASLRRADGERILPVRWSDNAVTLWPGESVTLTARCRSSDAGGEAPVVELSGWNVEARRVAARYSP
jgi:exo-1,4-beta-D-glucosaminidase